MFTLVFCQTVLSADLKSKDQGKTEKRALVEGNAALDKRAPTLADGKNTPTKTALHYFFHGSVNKRVPLQFRQVRLHVTQAYISIIFPSILHDNLQNYNFVLNSYIILQHHHLRVPASYMLTPQKHCQINRLHM